MKLKIYLIVLLWASYFCGDITEVKMFLNSVDPIGEKKIFVVSGEYGGYQVIVFDEAAR